MSGGYNAQQLPAKKARFRTWPITETSNLEPRLKEMGLKVPASAIDGTTGGGGSCLSDALVSVGPAGSGGTGSFISPDGLIITNHHVALDAVRQASSTEKDYLANGFVARSRSEELAGPDYEVWITRSCDDCSESILEVVRAEADPLARSNKVRDRKRELITKAEASLPSAGFRCEVKEMWAEKSYVLFKFERLRDVRIVYVPPMSLGNFGGDTDNFEWPRHSADFTLLRTYVGPNGEAAEPSSVNVPYKPSKFLRASTKGVEDGDFVFLLGFPGHTMRYAPSCRLSYSDEVAVPNLVRDFGRKLDLIRKHSSDRAVALKTMSAKKGLANEHKRSAGKRVMMRKLGLLAERVAEEKALCAKAPEVAPVLEKLAGIYAQLRAANVKSDALERLRGIYQGSALLAMGHMLHEASVEASKPDAERETNYRQRDRTFVTQRFTKRMGDMHIPLEIELVSDAMEAARTAGLEAAAEALGDPKAAVESSKLPSLSAADFGAVFEGAAPPNDPFVAASAAVYAAFKADRDSLKSLLSQRDNLLAQLLDLQRANAGAEEDGFYPDANSTLRISAGNVEGYVAADALQCTPITTIGGLIDKHVEAELMGTGVDDYDCPGRLVELCTSEPDYLKTPVCCLYSTDTVGGNSGSPVMNADGEFVAINFDRQRQGLMNEFKWSHEYSRSIGCDVRYILWLIGTYDAAGHLVEEMTSKL